MATVEATPMSGEHPTGAIEFRGETWIYLCRGIVRGRDPAGPVEAAQVWFSVPGTTGEWLASPELPADGLDLSEGTLRDLLAQLVEARGEERDREADRNAGP